MQQLPKFESHYSSFYGTCPNLYKGRSAVDFAEKFICRSSIMIKSCLDDKPVTKTITLKDLNKLKAIGKNLLVLKTGTRNFEFQNSTEGENRCLNFCQLINLQHQRLYQTDCSKHSDLYQGHFYVMAANDPSKFDLYIVMKKCEIILNDLIKKVHKLDKDLDYTYNANFGPNNVEKFPTSILISICKIFYTSAGFRHNNLQPKNVAFSVKKDKVTPEYFNFRSASQIY